MTKKNLTHKQQKLINLITDNLGNTKKTKSLYSMMLEAGYAESSAKQQSAILEGIQNEVDGIVDSMREIRKKAIERVDKTIDEAEIRDATRAIDILTKNIQLLTGGDTERMAHTGLDGLLGEIQQKNKSPIDDS